MTVISIIKLLKFNCQPTHQKKKSAILGKVAIIITSLSVKVMIKMMSMTMERMQTTPKSVTIITKAMKKIIEIF